MQVKDLSDTFHQVTTTMEESMVLHVVAAIALHKRMNEKSEIEKAYEHNKKEYFDSYRNSNYYKHKFLMSMPADDSVLMQKMIGMYLYEEAKGQGKELLKKYIIAGFKKTHDHVLTNQEINLRNLFLVYEKEGLPDFYNTLIGAIALFLGYPTKEVVNDAHLRETIYNMLVNVDEAHVEKLSKKNDENELPALRKFQDTMGFKFTKEETVDSILAKHDSFVLEKRLTAEEKKGLLRKGDWDPLYKKGLMRYWKPLTAIFRLKHLNDMHFGDMPVTRAELTEIYTVYQDSIEKERMKEEEFELFFMSSLLTLMLTKFYVKLRDKYQVAFEQDSGIADLLSEDKFAQEKVRMMENEKEMRHTLTEQNLLIARQQAQLEELQRKLKEREESGAEYNLLKKEVVALREYVFQEENDSPYNENDDLEELNSQIKVLHARKIAVIGGHPKWHAKLKEFLPNIRVVAPEELGIDLTFLNQMDIVCFETTYNNHSQYNRVLNQLKNDDTKLLYINEKNIERVISLIAQKLK